MMGTLHVPWAIPARRLSARAGFGHCSLVLVAALFVPSSAAASPGVTVGSKKFTESVILGEIVTAHLRAHGREARHRRELGGTRVLWNALLGGHVHVYPEYTGTLRQELLPDAGPALEGLRAAAEELGVGISDPIGFNNTYALGMDGGREIWTISDLADHPNLVFGFSNEFLDRADGWPALRSTYGLPQTPRGLDHDLAYRGLEAGDIDVIDLYSTDAEIAHYQLTVLEDDRGMFPEYQAVLVYRLDVAAVAPELLGAVAGLAGTIDEAAMIRMNSRVKLSKLSEASVAAKFVKGLTGEVVEVEAETRWTRFTRNTRDHLVLVAVSLGAAILVSIPLGIVAARRRRTGAVILGTVGIIQTIPSLALLVFMIPLLGIGGPPAIVALFLYSLLPIVRNTHAGLTDLPPHIRESAAATGLPSGARLRLVELPMASRTILAGIKTAAVINVGTATLGALIGAGGYGAPILTGIRLDEVGLILEGAVPAAGLALVVQGLFELVERRLPRPPR